MLKNQRDAHLTLDSPNTLVIPRPQSLNIRIPLPPALQGPVKFRCDLEGNVIEGVLDQDGRLQVPNAHLASTGLLEVWCFGEDQEPLTWALELDMLIEPDTVAGLQSRLNNLGYQAGPVDGIIGAKTRSATRNFQFEHQLKADGEAGPRTVQKLKDIYGC
ncbi:MAG: peptidoglycan-binding domain-containing protein [Ketobacteraceae bacterium]|nr:peptidoglycan-binding domain-containing protein [Ketobacteraceae bacterium]